MDLLSLGFDSRAGLCARLIQIRARPMPKKQARVTGRVIVFFMAGFLSEIPVRGSNTTSHNLCHLAMDGAMNVVTFYTSAGLCLGVDPAQWCQADFTNHSGRIRGDWLIQYFPDWLSQANSHRERTD